MPVCATVDGVFGIGDEENGPVSRGEFEGAEDGGEFGALIRLSGGRKQGFGCVSAWKEGKEKFSGRSSAAGGRERILQGLTSRHPGQSRSPRRRLRLQCRFPMNCRRYRFEVVLFAVVVQAVFSSLAAAREFCTRSAQSKGRG